MPADKKTASSLLAVSSPVLAPRLPKPVPSALTGVVRGVSLFLSLTVTARYSPLARQTIWARQEVTRLTGTIRRPPANNDTGRAKTDAGASRPDTSSCSPTFGTSKARRLSRRPRPPFTCGLRLAPSS